MLIFAVRIGAVVSVLRRISLFVLARAHLRDVLLQVLRVEEVRVTGVNDLEQEVGLLDDAPELLPDFDVLLERRDCQFDVSLFDGGEVPSPL